MEEKKICDLRLVQHTTPRNMGYHGFTVKPGHFFGTATWDGVKAPVFWSGWTSGGAILLYNCTTRTHFWAGGDDIDGYAVVVEPDWWSFEEEMEQWDSVPFFAN